MDKNQHKSTLTKPDVVNGDTGLTPIQEQTALLLASGQNIKNVADSLNINRGTIYNWLKFAPFMCFYNRQCTDNRNGLIAGLCGLAGDALQVFKDCLKSENEAIKLKAAIWLTERICNTQIGEADIRTLIEKECTHGIGDGWLPTPSLDEFEYKAKLSEFCLDDV